MAGPRGDEAVILFPSRLKHCDISGPDTIHLSNADEFSMRPTARPSPFTQALFCSWLSSKAVLENGRRVLLTVNFPLQNSANIPGCLSLSIIMSRRWIAMART